MDVAVFADNIGAVSDMRSVDAAAHIIVSLEKVVIGDDAGFLEDDISAVSVFPFKVYEIQFVQIFMKKMHCFPPPCPGNFQHCYTRGIVPV